MFACFQRRHFQALLVSGEKQPATTSYEKASWYYYFQGNIKYGSELLEQIKKSYPTVRFCHLSSTIWTRFPIEAIDKSQITD